MAMAVGPIDRTVVTVEKYVKGTIYDGSYFNDEFYPVTRTNETLEGGCDALARRIASYLNEDSAHVVHLCPTTNGKAVIEITPNQPLSASVDLSRANIATKQIIDTVVYTIENAASLDRKALGDKIAESVRELGGELKTKDHGKWYAQSYRATIGTTNAPIEGPAEAPVEDEGPVEGSAEAQVEGPATLHAEPSVIYRVLRWCSIV